MQARPILAVLNFNTPQSYELFSQPPNSPIRHRARRFTVTHGRRLYFHRTHIIISQINTAPRQKLTF